MIVKRLMLVASLALLPTGGFAGEIIAKDKTWWWSVSVNADGNSWDKSCKLKLTAETHQNKQEINIKREFYNCGLYGPVHLHSAAESLENESSLVFLEAARGGDGDHTGPIVEVFKLTRNKIKKLGEQELFDAIYYRKGEQIKYVTGSVVFDLCESCDGPEVSLPEDTFYIPAKMTIAEDKIIVKPALSKQERKAVLDKFDARVAIATKENESDKEFPKFVKSVRDKLASFLKR